MSYEKDLTPRDFIIWGAKGLAVGVIVAAVLLFALSAVAYNMTDPGLAVEIMGYSSLFIAAAVSGVIAARVSGEVGGKAAAAGGIAGLMMLCLILMMSMIPAEAATKPLSVAITVLMYAAVPAVAAIGGFALRKKHSHRPRHKRKRRR